MNANVKVVIVTALAFIAASAAATNWHLYASVAAPAPNVRGYHWGPDDHDFVLTDGDPPRLWRFDPQRKRFVGGAVNLDIPKGAWGVAYWRSKGGLWVSHYGNSHIYNLTLDGSVISSFRCPRPNPADIMIGIFTEPDIAAAIPDDNVILILTTTGSLVKTYPGPGTRVTAGCHPRSCADIGTGRAYTWDGTFPAPGAAAFMQDEIELSGRYYRVETTNMYDNTVRVWDHGGVQPVFPASLGRVKALFQ
jgi:hypothetical protein